MSKFLIVGDVHATVEELQDCQNLIDGVKQVIKDEKPDNMVFLGDIFHNHGIVAVDCLAFWRENLLALGELVPTHVLVGNHDRPGDASNPNYALIGLQGIHNVQIVASPSTVDGTLLLPYTPSQEVFREWVRASTARVVFGHQATQGAKYDNGSLVNDGFSLDEFSDIKFIFGHIHTPMTTSNAVYIGAPRWRTLSDANIDRSICLIQTNKDGYLLLKEFPTDKYCKRIIHIEDRQENPIKLEINPQHRYIVDVYGTEDYIRTKKAEYAGCRVRTFKTQTKTKKVSESMGISKALSLFVDDYQPKYGTSKDILKEMIQKRLQ